MSAVLKPFLVVLQGIYNTLASSPEFAAVLRGKLATVVQDRRFWTAAITVISMVAGVPLMADQVDKAGGEVAGNIQVIIQSAGILISYVTLVLSWTKRAPSGKNYLLEDQFASAINTLYRKDE